MKKIFISLLLATAAVTSALAAGGGIAWDKAPAKTTDMVALQNGAKIFVNYCQNCHAAG